jgi:glucose 1-dehydrogenase
MGKLAGQVALVTGASRGIGRATAIALAKAGADVAINYRSHPDEAEEVLGICRAAGVRARLAPGDVADQAAVEKMVADTVREFGKLDIAVSNAAYSDRESYWIADMAGFTRTINVTMWGAFYLLRAATQHMVTRGEGGSIVVVSSPHAYTPVPKAMAYNMAKAAIDHMVKTAATEVYDKRIRVNTLYPGWIDTPGERKFVSEEDLQRQAKGIPWGRLGKPEEIARGILFLVDPESDYVTGTQLLIDGGISLPWWAKEGFRTE